MAQDRTALAWVVREWTGGVHGHPQYIDEVYFVLGAARDRRDELLKAGRKQVSIFRRRVNLDEEKSR